MKFNWGHGIFIFISLFVILAVTFIVFSLQHSEDLVTDDYYEQGASYTHQIELIKRSEVYNDSIQFHTQNQQVTVEISPAILNTTDSIDLVFYRPSDRKNDLNLKVSVSPVITIPVTHFVKGRYKVLVGWKMKQLHYQVEKSLFIE